MVVKDIKQFKDENERHFLDLTLGIISWYKYVCNSGRREDIVEAVKMLKSISDSHPGERCAKNYVMYIMRLGSSDIKEHLKPKSGPCEFVEYIDEYICGLFGGDILDLRELNAAYDHLSYLLEHLAELEQFNPSDTWAIEYAEVWVARKRVSKKIEELSVVASMVRGI